MGKSRIAYLVFLLQIFSNFESKGQRFYSNRDGIAQSSILCISPDNDGFVWLGTYDGLIRFDGHQFKNISLSAIQQINYGQIIYGILEDPTTQHLLIGTEKGVVEYNKNKNSVYRKGFTFLSEKSCYPIAFFREKLYMLVKENGLCYYDTLRRNLYILDSRIPFLEGDVKECFSLLVAAKSSIWYAHNKTIYQYDFIQEKRVDSIQLNEQVECVTWYNGVLYIGTKNNITIYKNKVFTHYPIPYTPTTLVIDSATNFLYFTTIEKRVQKVSLASLNTPFVNDDGITKLNGLMINRMTINGNSLFFSVVPGNFGVFTLHHFSLDKAPEKQTSKGYFVRALAQVDDSTVIVATQDRGVFLYNYKQHCLSQQTILNAIKEQSFCLKRNGDDIYIATLKAVYSYNVKTKQFKQLLAFEKDEFTTDISIYNNEVYCHQPDATYVIRNGKLFKKNYIDETKTHLQLFNIDSFCFTLTSADSLNVYKYQNGKFNFLQSGIKQINSSFYNYILKLKNNNFAIATSNGLYIVDRHLKTVLKEFNQTKGLPNNFIYVVLEDSNENLWITSNKGLSVITKTGQIKNFNIDDGLQDLEFNSLSCLKTTDRILFFGGVSGFNFFNPNTFRFDSTLAKPYFGSIIINDEKEISSKPFVQEPLILSYQDNTISLNYACIDYLSNGQNQYKYHLDGIDNKWVSNGEKLFVRYPNLPAGKYTFKLKVANSYGVWNETPLSLDITITPPYYQTWWFYLLCCLFMCSVIYGIYRYRLSQQLKAFRMRQNIANDLHDDIGSTLASISFTSQYLKKELQSKDKHLSEVVGGMYENSRTAMENLSDIVWSINPMNDKFLFIINKFRSIGNTIEQTTDIAFEFHVDEACNQLELNMQARKNIYLIVKEIINNTLKHAHAQHIDVRFQLQHQLLIITIADDGIGFEATSSFVGNGLKSIQTRVEELNGKHTLNARPNIGVAYNIAFPLSHLVV